MLDAVNFRALDYGESVARILNLGGGGTRVMPLSPAGCSSDEARAAIKATGAKELFPGAPAPEAALSGLYLYFSCLDDAHAIAQDIPSREGSFWHGIMHRQEPDPRNADYWFRRVGPHPIFPPLRNEAHRQRFDTGADWDPFEFIEFCETARVRPGSEEQRIGERIQLVEWQLLFDYCARGPRETAA